MSLTCLLRYSDVWLQILHIPALPLPAAHLGDQYVPFCGRPLQRRDGHGRCWLRLLPRSDPSGRLPAICRYTHVAMFLKPYKACPSYNGLTLARLHGRR